MPEQATVTVNQQSVIVSRETTVAAAIMMAGWPSRRSVTGEPRDPLCGMGTCFECRATIDGVPHARSCQIVCVSGMQINTDD